MTHYSDYQRKDFLRALDASDAELGEWEVGFVGSNLTRNSFTPKQREVIDKMIEKYKDRIKW